jgi:membrane protease YdiL (CAAX protease family)
MTEPTIAFRTPSDVTGWKRWWPYSPLARILLFFAIFGALVFLMRLGFVTAGWAGPGAPAPQRFIAMFLMQLVPALTAYLVLVRYIERRKPAELAWRKVLPHGAAGTLAGAMLITAVVGALWLAGSYQVVGTNPDAPWVRQLLLAGLGTAIAEEIVTRGILFRIIEEGLGTWGALLISALVFGFGHIFNPGATAWTSIAIAVEAGLLFGLLYHVSRSLPLCMGLHMAWNFTQGTVWGIPVSGTDASGWLVSKRDGPDWLSGGIFGAEASVVAIALCSAVTLALLVTALRRGSIVPPWFRRDRVRAAAPAATGDNEMARAA